MTLSVRLFPARSVSLRDSGQLEDVGWIVAQAHQSLHRRIEAPIRPGDPRAADLLPLGPTEALHIEVERYLVDVQAQLRAAQLKRAVLAESLPAPVRLIIAVPRTRRTTTLLATSGSVLKAALPATSAQVLRAIRLAEPLGQDGLLLLPRRS